MSDASCLIQCWVSGRRGGCVGEWRRLERQDENLFTVHRMILCSMGLITFDADPRSAEKHLKARGLAGGSRGLVSSSVAEEVPQES